MSHWVVHQAWQTVDPGRIDPKLLDIIGTIERQAGSLAPLIKAWREARTLGSGWRNTLDDVSIARLDFYRAGAEVPLMVRLTVANGHAMTAAASDEPQRSDVDPFYFVAYTAPAKGETKAVLKVLHLNGTSPPIHEMNSDLGGIDLAKAEAYCDFFCGFITGADGPFLVRRQSDALGWTRTDDVPFYQHQHIYELRRATNPGGTVRRPTIIADIKSDLERRLKSDGRFQPYSEDVVARFASKAKLPEDQRKAWAANLTERATAPGGTSFIVLIEYASTLFVSVMRVLATGMVEMLEDEPAGSDDNDYPLAGVALPLAKWSFEDRRRADTLKALVYHPRKDDVRERLDEIKKGTSNEIVVSAEGSARRARAQPVECGPGAISGALRDYSGQTLELPVTISDYFFYEDVDFSNTTFLGSVTFRNCRFLRGLRFENARIHGGLTLDDCEIAGLSSRGAAPCLGLTGAHLDGDLRLRRTSVHGTAMLDRMTVSGRTRIEGCAFHPPHLDEVHEEGKLLLPAAYIRGRQSQDYAAVALDLRHSHFNRGLSIAADFPSNGQSGLGGSMEQAPTPTPTVVIGSVRAEDTRIAGGLVLNGLVTCRLDADSFRIDADIQPWTHVSFDQSRIEGNVRMWSHGEGALDSWQVMRTIISSSLSFADAHIEGYCMLQGLWIDSDLNFARATCTGPVSLTPIAQHDVDAFAATYPSWTLPQVGDKKTPKYRLPDLTCMTDDAGARRTARFLRTHVGGVAEFDNADINLLNLNGVYVKGRISCESLRVGDLSARIALAVADKTSDCASLFDDATPADGKPAATFKDYLTRHCRETVRLTKSRQGDKALLVLRSEAAGLDMRGAHVRGRAMLSGLWLSNDLGESASAGPSASSRRRRFLRGEPSAIAAGAPAAAPVPASVLAGVAIEDAVVDGPLSFFDDRRAAELTETLEEPSESLFRHQLAVLAQAATGKGDREPLPSTQAIAAWVQKEIGGDFDCAWIDGRLRIVNCTIDGTLNLTGLSVDGKIDIKDVTLSSDLIARSEWQDTHYQTVAHNLNLEMLRCDGDVKVPGLKLVQETGSNGSFEAPNAIIKGHMEFLHVPKGGVQSKHDGPRDPADDIHRASVAGRVILTGSEIGWLKVACGAGQAEQADWVLERTRIGRLDIWPPYPKQMDMGSSTFGRIVVPGAGTSREATWRTRLLTAAGGGHTKSLEVARHFEQQLRRENRLAEANRVYAEPLGPVRGTFFRFMASTLGSFGLFAAGLMLMLTAYAGVTSQVANWEQPPLVTLLTNLDTRPKSRPVGDGDCKPDRTVCLTRQQQIVKAIEIGLPIIALTQRDNASDPKLAESGATETIVPGLTMPLAPQTVAVMITFAGWLVWGLFLLSVSGFTRRD